VKKLPEYIKKIISAISLNPSLYVSHKLKEEEIQTGLNIVRGPNPEPRYKIFITEEEANLLRGIMCYGVDTVEELLRLTSIRSHSS
jgi:hypothetical protein